MPKEPNSVEGIKANMQASRKRWFSSQSGRKVHQLYEELLPNDWPCGSSRAWAAEGEAFEKIA